MAKNQSPAVLMKNGSSSLTTAVEAACLIPYGVSSRLSPPLPFSVQCADYGKKHMLSRSENIPLISFRIRFPVRMWYELI